jgi:hypothetical protein
MNKKKASCMTEQQKLAFVLGLKGHSQIKYDAVIACY